MIQSYIFLTQIGLHPVRTCLVYNPPNSYVEYKQSLAIAAYLDNLATKPSPLILMGDFNVPDIIWATLSGSTFHYKLQPITGYQLFYTCTGSWYHT